MLKFKMHPGIVLKGELDEIGTTPTELAHQIGVPANRVLEIIRGKRGISFDTAMRFGHWFGTGAELWVNLQAQFDVVVADEQIGSKIRKLPINGSLAGRSQGDQLI